MNRALIFVTLCLATPFACDSAPEGPTEAQKAAAAEKEAEDKRIADRIQKRKDEDAAKQKAIDDAAKAKTDAIEKLMVLPEKMPTKIGKACDEVAAAQDRFTLKILSPDKIEQWNQGKGTMLGMTKRDCNKAGSLEVAACQIAALDAADAEDPVLRKATADILRACMDKYGKPAEGEKKAG